MIQVVKTKPMKSSTKVEGLLVQMDNKQWYAITRMMPARFGWYLRCGPCKSTGKMDLMNDILYMIPTKNKEEFQVGIDLLLDILNGNKEAVINMPDYNQKWIL
tara:strand:- start:154 stop:462 length:309 start_codon:yes stop_codon:yes gene_type:complete